MITTKHVEKGGVIICQCGIALRETATASSPISLVDDYGEDPCEDLNTAGEGGGREELVDKVLQGHHARGAEVVRGVVDAQHLPSAHHHLHTTTGLDTSTASQPGRECWLATYKTFHYASYIENAYDNWRHYSTAMI